MYKLEELERHKFMLLERGKQPVLKKKPPVVSEPGYIIHPTTQRTKQVVASTR